jgi:prepilin-type processing-associated H-X9-DG protein
LPLPSAIDVNNATVPEIGAAKDTTANIFSLLIYTGGISTETCICPAEDNTEVIQQSESYEFNNPKAASNPANALWDPAFSADFTNGHIGNFSYAHIPPSGPRLAHWSTATMNPGDAIMGNRGPQIASVTHNGDGSVTPLMAIPNSNTLMIHGSPNAWEGNIAYADGHVGFEIKMAPPCARPYMDAAGKSWPDTLFFDEPDDPSGANAYLGIFIKAGPKPADFVPIWD